MWSPIVSNPLFKKRRWATTRVRPYHFQNYTDMQIRSLIFLCTLLISINVVGQTNLDCNSATPLILSGACTLDFLPDSLDNAVPNACVDSPADALWYAYQASFSGTLLIETNARFNDAISVFDGNCGNLSLVDCTNRDEYGFHGERLFLPVTSGTNYWIQISSVSDNYGIEHDSFCLQINQTLDSPTPPLNDLCDNAATLVPGQNCATFTNENANMEDIFPINEERARADIWWNFTAGESELVVLSTANFSNILSVYEGECNDLVAVNSTGSSSLLLTDLIVGNTYFLQVSGNFATIEGTVCVEIQNPESAENDDCEDAIAVSLNEDCIPFSNYDMGMSGIQPSCEFYPEADIWFSFVAPASHGIKFRTQTDFLHAVAIYEGTCDDLEEVFCISNPQSCAGYTIVDDLMSGQTYYMQIMSKGASFGHLEGTGCLEILDIEQGDNFLPLSLTVEPFCLSVATAELQIAVSGGTGNYTISGNQAGEILTSGSTYLVQAKDDQGCVQIQSGQVNCSTPAGCGLFYFIETRAISCPDEENGSATLSISGTDTPVFEWSNGVTTATVDNLAAGSYSVTVSESDSCHIVVQVNIPSPASLFTEETIVASSDENMADGSIIILPNGGTPPYQFEWSTGETSSLITDLLSGEYAYTLTDANDCTLSDLVIVEVDPLCPDNRVLSDAVLANTMETQAAADFIVSTSNISSQANVVYKAGNRIELKTGFQVLEGGRFEGIIEGCEPLIDNVKESLTQISKLAIAPNPFIDEAQLAFDLKTAQPVTIELLRPNGQLVRKIASNQEMTAGTQQVKIKGKGLLPGVYFVSVIGIDFRETVKVYLVEN